MEQVTEKDPNSMHIMTFNQGKGQRCDSKDRPKRVKQSFESLLKREKPDVMFIQEISTIKVLKKQITYKIFTPKGRKTDTAVVLVDEKWDVSGPEKGLVKVADLKETYTPVEELIDRADGEEVTNSEARKEEWKKLEKDICAEGYCMVIGKWQSTDVLLVSCHARQKKSDEKKRFALRQLLRVVHNFMEAKKIKVVIIGGDFNLPISAARYIINNADDLKDVMQVEPYSVGKQKVGCENEKEPEIVLDYFITSTKVVHGDTGLVGDRERFQKVFDHSPVESTIYMDEYLVSIGAKLETDLKSDIKSTVEQLLPKIENKMKTPRQEIPENTKRAKVLELIAKSKVVSLFNSQLEDIWPPQPSVEPQSSTSSVEPQSSTSSVEPQPPTASNEQSLEEQMQNLSL